jgi:hypothetical protein
MPDFFENRLEEQRSDEDTRRQTTRSKTETWSREGFMAKGTSIEWANDTFNPWWGCEHASPGCDFCYAETFARRIGANVWGNDTPRRFFGAKHWNEPRAWEREATSDGVRRRVFCASMADVLEDRPDLAPWREKLCALIEQLQS